MKAVQYNRYGGVDVLQVADVPSPAPGPGQALVRVEAAGLNPGEAHTRAGHMQAVYSVTFPTGQGHDLAGTVVSVGEGVTEVAAGDDVIGWVDPLSSQAEYVVTEADHLVPKPAGVPWDVAGALASAGFTAWAAVRAVEPAAGDTVVVAGAAGGVGSIAVQLAVRAGATVIGLAGADNHKWLSAHGVTPVTYGPGVADRIRAAAAYGRVDAFIDTQGADYVEIALDDLGVAPGRFDTIVRFDAVQTHGVKFEGYEAGVSAGAAVLAELADLIAAGDLEIPIAATYPLAEVRTAFDHLEGGHVRGKIVLLP
ncbi:NADP-dependent oxidoreductase [Amycolatopsis sp. lyj-109]|uniref:NADP-dependent oxidoreductase n=1 Tax=Amycolatopsis sp. lyj-109 TaxID=2789287 RepID=UPI003977E47C